MARTLIGQLILRLKAEGLHEADKVGAVMRSVEASAKRLSNTPAPAWGVGFQRQLERLKLTKSEINSVRTSWATMHDEIRRKNLSGALRVSELASWKNATVMQFAAARDEHARAMQAIEDRARVHNRILRGITRSALVAGGAYTGAYGMGMVGRQGVIASAVEERERFRADMAGIPEREQAQLFDEALRLSMKYRAASLPEIAEMARNARATMGTTDRAISVLEQLTQGLVTLKSTKGPDAAAHELNRLVRGIDNLGKNAEGDIGIEDTKALIEGLIRASQIEGRELDVGTLFDFARRAKVAGPALDTDFLANVAPAIMQDMTSHGAGTALAMAFKSFIIGDRSIAGRRYMQAQSDMGLRDGLTLNSRGNVENAGSIIDPDLLGRNPYEWVKEYLIPALEGKGVDTADDNAIAQAVGKLSGNTNATGMLTRMVQQREQIDRLILAYQNTLGLDAAETASSRDPFVAWEGFKSALANLSGAMGGMPSIISGLNTFADAINNIQKRIREGDPLVSNMATVAGVGVAGGGAYVLGRGVWGLITAGTNLNTAAANLNVAAARLGGGAVADAAGGKKGGGSIFGTPGLIGAGALLSLGGSSANNNYTNATEEERAAMREAARESTAQHNAENGRSFWEWLKGDFGKEDFSFRESMKINAGISRPQAAVAEAKSAGTEIESALSVKATPQVDTTQLRELLALIDRARSGLLSLGRDVTAASANVGAELRRNFSD